MYNTQRVFSPFLITDFGPFNKIDDVVKLYDEIRVRSMSTYNNHRDYWRN